MQPPPDEFDLSQLLTRSARLALPAAQANGLQFLFDYEGDLPWVRGDEAVLTELVHDLLAEGVSMTSTGHLFFTTEVTVVDARSCRMVLRAASTAVLRDAPQISAACNASQGVRGRLDESVGRAHVQGLDVELSLQTFPGDGTVIRLECTLPVTRWIPQQADARQARAWLVADPPSAFESLTRRLQRLGWYTSAFRTPADALTQIAQIQAGRGTAPALVVARGVSGLPLDEFSTLALRLPRTVQVVLALLPGIVPEAALPATVDVRVAPFSPQELLEMTELACSHTVTPTGETRPAPLGLSDRKRILVAEDNPVNQIVAKEMLQVLGFEVAIAADGFEAVESCRREAPDAVLMDIQMPRLDGLQASRALRELQRRGELPEFPIIGATASPTTSEECRANGMQGFVSKPLDMNELANELRECIR
ncbi:response regulator [Caldimonas brevitalea]|uniref:Sensory box histidine kinase/response regulator n=1 Tax=Caldimonas brevitalea TaxID=413882 RepID=A0A0G3BIZ9_9BURK|nr:response regulator [Caldimonas brevitalea]AKJ29337.1 sensory box histidine kinase/response regulator [Caldimonas brevitalea]